MISSPLKSPEIKSKNFIYDDTNEEIMTLHCKKMKSQYVKN